MSFFLLVILFLVCDTSSINFNDSCTWCLLTKKTFVKVEYSSSSKPVYQCLSFPQQTIPLIVVQNATVTTIDNCTWELIGLSRKQVLEVETDWEIKHELDYFLHYLAHTIKILNHTIPTSNSVLNDLRKQESIGNFRIFIF